MFERFIERFFDYRIVGEYYDHKVVNGCNFYKKKYIKKYFLRKK